jgi:tight adherence protein B
MSRVVRARLARLTGDGRPSASRRPAGIVVRRPFAVVVRRPLAGLVLAAALVGGLAGALGGPVAAVIALWYTVLGLRAARRAVAERGVTARRTAVLDLISGLAADLRAGAAPAAAIEAARAALDTGVPDAAVGRALRRLSAAYDVSERLGAPLADLLDRVEVDLRGIERTRATVAAQTTGARASAALLALLPVAGVGLGYAMGADPGHALLRTPVGAGCALGALLLQCGGMAWTGRLCRAAVERAS